VTVTGFRGFREFRFLGRPSVCLARPEFHGRYCIRFVDVLPLRQFVPWTFRP